MPGRGRTATAQGRIFVATDSFSGSMDGVTYVVNKGTTVREGHPLWRRYREFFKVLDRADYELDAPVEQATAAPGELRP